MATENVVNVLKITDYSLMSAEIEADVLAKQIAGYSVVTANSMKSVDESTGDPVWLAILTYNKAISGSLYTPRNPDGSAIFGTDGFGNVKTSSLETLLTNKQVYDAGMTFMTTHTANGGTIVHSALAARSRLTVVNTVGSRALRQSKQYINYDTGKSQNILQTFAMPGGAEVGYVKKVGYFDDDNGVYYSVRESGKYMTVRSGVTGSPVDTTVAQADWTIDKMDGTGPSGITITEDMAKIFVCDIQWLGVGTVRVGFDIAGVTYWCHRWDHSDTLPVVYMSTPNLPARWEIECISTAGAPASASMDSICVMVGSNGGHNPAGMIRPATRGIVPTTINDTGMFPVVSIRTKATHLRATVYPLFASLITSTNADIYWELIHNATITAPTWVPVTMCAIEYDITSSVPVTGGTVVAADYFSNNAQSSNRPVRSILALAANYAGDRDTFTLAATRVGSASNSTMYGGLTYEVMM